jgi:transketolase
VLFDDNQISIDGKTSLAVSEDQLARFIASGWQVERVDGHDFDQIKSALQRAQTAENPYFIALRTTIGKGANLKSGSEESHGAPLGRAEISFLKQQLGFNDEPFWLPCNLLATWRALWERNKSSYLEWQNIFDGLPKQQKQFLTSNNLDIGFLDKIEGNGGPEATRASSGKLINELIKGNDKVICGSADLSLSNNIKSPDHKVITKDDFSGNFIHYGVREHAMAAIMNGLSLSGFLPIGGSFFVFTDYMKPAIRLSAIMHCRVIYVMTHDSIGVGEDGPTHQPIEQLAAMRSIPNLLVLRPMDQQETKECWQIALENHNGPSMIVLTRQNVPQIRSADSTENLCKRGAYALHGDLDEADLLLFASGSEVSLALETAKIIESKIKCCVISVPSFELFFNQDSDYRNKLLHNTKKKVAIEAATSFGWHKIIGSEGIFFGLDNFGVSAPGSEVYKTFKLTAEDILAEFQKLALSSLKISVAHLLE